MSIAFQDQSEFLSIARDQAGVLSIKITRPQVRNALNFAIVRKLTQLVQSPDMRSTRAIVVGSDGDVFSAGADLKERRTFDEPMVRQWLQELNDCLDLIERAPVPVVAAIQGPALGGGCELALACDFRVASPLATFQLPEVNLAIIPGGGGTYRLPRIVGRARALDMIVGRRKLTAQEALDWGLVQRLATGASAWEVATSWASDLAQLAPIAVSAAKKAILDSDQSPRDLMESRQVELGQYERCLESQDRLEALAAFAEKRQPIYQGR